MTTPALRPAPCGIDCALCLGYQRPRNRCVGCSVMAGNKPGYCLRCRIANCERLATLPEPFCSPACDSFPCKRLRDLAKRYRTKYGVDLLANLDAIARVGWHEFADENRRAWTCGDCGGLLCVHRPNCLLCDAPTPRFPPRE